MARNDKKFVLIDECNNEIIGDSCTTMADIEQMIMGGDLDEHADEGDYVIYELTRASRQPSKGGWRIE